MCLYLALAAVEPTVPTPIFIGLMLLLLTAIVLACRIRPIAKRDRLVPVVLALFPSILMLRNTDYKNDGVLFLGELVAATTGGIVAVIIASEKGNKSDKGGHSKPKL